MVKRPGLHQTLLLAGLLGLGHSALLFAQDANNVLGLPAVPQRSAGPTPAGTITPQKSTATKPTDAQIKSTLSGRISAASSYQNGLLTVRVTTEKVFVGNADRAQALQAAKLIQRDARLACAKLCKPAAMPLPMIQANNTLSFDIVVDGYQGNMSTPDMINLVSGKRISAAAQAAPIAIPSITTPASAASQP